MPLTPADVHNVAFSKPPIGKRGYNEDEVDQFLDLVEDALAQLTDENDELRARVQEPSQGEQTAQSTTPAAVPVASGSQVDEAELRAEIEAELRATYESRVREAQEAKKRAEDDARAARKEVNEARKQAEEASRNAGQDSQVKAAAAPVPPVSGATETSATADTHIQAAKVLGLAQQMADRLTTDAQDEARSMLDEARGAAERQLKDAETRSRAQLDDAEKKATEATRTAETRAQKLVSEADKKATETTNDANSRAEAQIRQAEEQAAKLQADAERKHTEIMNTVKQQQAALEHRIAELRTFEREYRTRLKTLLQSQLEELESRGTSAPNGDAGQK